MIKLNLENVVFKNKNVDSKKIFLEYEKDVKLIHKSIKDRNCINSKMLGWMDYPFEISENLFNKIEKAAEIWQRKNIKDIVIIGIGGSYLGTRAAIDICKQYFNRKINLYYVSNISSTYINSMLNTLKNKEFGIVVISKSGTTLEPNIALRLFYEALNKKYGSEESRERVLIVTSENNSKLFNLAKKQKWEIFGMPENVGGRFSTITSVGLLPMALAGINIRQVIEGSKKALNDTNNDNIEKNIAYQYAVLRHYFYKQEKKVMEIFGTYEDQLYYFTEHLKQLFSESECKNKKGLMPLNCIFTTDLHSIGQGLQDGKKNFFETILLVNNPSENIVINEFFNNEDGLEFINNKDLHSINTTAALSTAYAHSAIGKSPVIIFNIKELNDFSFGYLYSFFSKALAMSALLLGVNPFNQPGVESYKKEMFNRLKK